MNAPICLFVFNRSYHTKITLDALSLNPESKNSILYIFCDGPPSTANKELLTEILLTREIVRNESRFQEVIIEECENNLGLASSLIKGISKVIAKHGRAIILEDDIVVSPYFLDFMNQGLDIYKNNSLVGCICTYMYPVQFPSNLPETFFLNYNSCWGWGTWDRVWSKCDFDGNKLLNEIVKNKSIKSFDFNGTRKHFKMLKNQINGKNNSWAIRWDAFLHVNSYLSLFPKYSFVENIGFDGSGIHSGKGIGYQLNLVKDKIILGEIEITENLGARNQLERFFRSQNRYELFRMIIRMSQYSPKQILSKIINRLK